MTQLQTSATRPFDAATLLHVTVRWYVLEMPVRIIRGYAAYAAALSEVFSVLFLLRTLFAPWKAITDRYPSKGFNLERIMETFALNMTTRLVGAVIRLGTILAGIAAQGLCAACALAFLAAWFLYPALLLSGILFIFFGSVFG